MGRAAARLRRRCTRSRRTTLAQGTLQLLYELQEMLAEISGMDAVTLQPAAGAHGELTGILLIRAYHLARGDTERQEVIVPDSSHGTNPATASMAGFRTVTVPLGAGRRRGPGRAEGRARPRRPRRSCSTNPSTLGLFERRITELLDAVHAAGALAYMDGANMNAVLGKFRPGRGRLRRDALQPAQDLLDAARRWRPRRRSGGGRPRSWRRSCQRRWSSVTADGRTGSSGQGSGPRSIGRVRAYQGSAGVLVRAYTYIRAHGGSGLSRSARTPSWPRTTCASVSARPTSCRTAGPCKHEFVATAKPLHQATGVRTLDVAAARAARGAGAVAGDHDRGRAVGVRRGPGDRERTLRARPRRPPRPPRRPVRSPRSGYRWGFFTSPCSLRPSSSVPG